MSGQDAAGTSRIAVIDGLRALAVLSVIAFHFRSGLLASGFVGVDVFFAISGYVIARSLSRHGTDSFASYIADFYRRRVIRILPALACCLVVVTLLTITFVPDSWLSGGNDRTGVLAFFGLSNFGLLMGLDGYFQARSDFNPFVHTWSLGVEEQFYLIFPVVFWFWLNLSQQRRASARSRLLARWALPVLAVCSLVYAAVETTRAPVMAFYMLPSRFWELAAGALLFQAHATGRFVPRSGTGTCLVAYGGALLLVASFLWTDPAAFPFPYALGPVVGSLALVAAGAGGAASQCAVVRLLRVPAVVYVGRISYSLYLWHWPVVCLLRWTIGFSDWRISVAALLFTLMLGAASYHWIEIPFQKAQVLTRPAPWRVALAVVFLSGVLGTGAYMLFRVPTPLRLSVVENERGWHPWDVNAPTSEQLPAHAGASARLFVMGDSHAGAYSGMVPSASARVGMDVTTVETSGCPIADLLKPQRGSALCGAATGNSLAQLDSDAKPGDIVFLVSLRSVRLSNQWGELKLSETSDGNESVLRAQALGEAREIVRHLRTLGLTIVIDAPKPVFRAPPFRCSDWFNRRNPVCTPGFDVEAAFLHQRNTAVWASLRALEREFPGLIVWDPFPILCPGATCSALRNGKPLFFDGDHLSGRGNAALVPAFTALLESLSSRKQAAEARTPLPVRTYN